MKTLLVTILLLLSSISSFSQSSQVAQQWVARFNGSGNTYDGSNISKIDKYGNIYVSGFSDGTGGNMDFALLKYNSAGVLQWSQVYDSPSQGTDDCYWMTLDGDGNVYQSGISETGVITMKYNSSGDRLWIIKNGGPIAADISGNLYMIEGAQRDSIYTFNLIKYNSAGDKLWAKRNESKYGAGVMSLTTSQSGDIFMTGEINNLSSVDIGTWKYDTNGNLIWEARYQFSSIAHYRGVFIKNDPSGNTYVAGESTCSGCGNNDFVVLKYNSTGEQQWAALYHGTEYNSQYIRGIAIDNEQNVYITGESGGDYATIKYNTNGEQQWAATYNGEANDRDEVYGIAFDTAGNSYVTGWSMGSEGMDCVTLKYNTYGVQQWKQAYHSSVPGTNCANSILVDSSGSVYVAGFSEGEGSDSDIILIKYLQATEISPVSTARPSKYSLSQNYPNPFNPVTTIEFSLPENTFVTLKVFDITAREVYILVNENLSPGAYRFNFNGISLSSGTYFYKLETSKFTETKKMILVK
jgi:uncharacterized delta-60 repeat protein